MVCNGLAASWMGVALFLHAASSEVALKLSLALAGFEISFQSEMTLYDLRRIEKAFSSIPHGSPALKPTAS